MSAEAGIATPTRRRESVWRQPALVVGLVMIGVMVLIAVAAPLLTPYDPNAQDLSAGFLPPGGAHPLGTDQLGRDIWARIAYGAATDVRIGVFGILLPATIGSVLGLVAGYFGGVADAIIGYLVDVVLTFPFYILALALVVFLGPGELSIYVALAAVAWVHYARLTRSVTLGLRQRPWVEAARAGGLGHGRVIFRHILPNLWNQIVTLALSEVVFVILAVVTLSYLGLGVQAPTAEWGRMISDGRQFLTTNWWVSVFPGLAVFWTGLGFALLADGYADYRRVRL
ncbi:MAG: ABC transporter permease [Microbacterium ginsengisoli]|jgi:peptide/nickel transport system permease protein|nr:MULTISPECIES: ABC transporter permease [unclassified Microbacterium]KQR91260.1 nickel ABC transporter permease [Microbacterium sp. Leaf347]KQS01252.1 nickel ABC transporter permease [Microbacterium sp. Leaf351]MBN9197068.1 ABC transporter permease [Microbacterium ginsengisoli]OJU77025.1 MAG: nickel ABC transporter permease [Microbacterium sp. 71-23]